MLDQHAQSELHFLKSCLLYVAVVMDQSMEHRLEQRKVRTLGNGSSGMHMAVHVFYNSYAQATAGMRVIYATRTRLSLSLVTQGTTEPESCLAGDH